MSNYDIKQRRWDELKAAVGTGIFKERTGRLNMSIDDLLLNIKAVSFDSLVRQSDIQTEEDKLFYVNKGYHSVLTESEFKEKFSVDPSCIWYTPSFSQSTLYFNDKTFAAAPFHMDFYLAGIFPDMDKFYEIIAEREQEAAENDFMDSLISLPDAMRLEYFQHLIEEKGTDIPGLYNLFFSHYVESDYGFGNMDPKTIRAILDAKTPEEKALTNQKLEELPDSVKIYRGGNTASTDYNKAYSWTLDINVANFFACRRGTGDGYIAEALVPKEDIIEYLEGRGEQEVFVNPEKLQITAELPIKGLDFVASTLPVIAPMYRNYLSQMEELSFAQESSVHGYGHEARVLLNSLTLSELLDLPLRDRKVLATAAIFHDTQRVNDDVDPHHGKASREYYSASTPNPDPLVEFLCEYHCLPDEEAYQEIRSNRKLSKNRTWAKLLFDTFKDADALDRVRFGLKDLDLNQLRLPVSKELSLVARLYLENVEVNIKPRNRKSSLSDKIASAAARTSQEASRISRNKNKTEYEH